MAMQTQLLQTRRGGQPSVPLTLEQIRALPPEQLDDLEVFFQGGWVWPAKWMGSGDDIEVVR